MFKWEYVLVIYFMGVVTGMFLAAIILAILGG